MLCALAAPGPHAAPAIHPFVVGELGPSPPTVRGVSPSGRAPGWSRSSLSAKCARNAPRSGAFGAHFLAGAWRAARRARGAVKAMSERSAGRACGPRRWPSGSALRVDGRAARGRRRAARPHLPCSTNLVAEAIAEQVVAERGDELDLWLLPPLAYSKSNEHAWAGGTMWLSATTLLAMLHDLGRSVAARRPPARFLNGHGGNTALVNVACRGLRLPHGLRCSYPSRPAGRPGRTSQRATSWGWGSTAGCTRRRWCCTCGPTGRHRGRRAATSPSGWPPTARAVRGRRELRLAVERLRAVGEIGDPTGANPERGQGLFEGVGHGRSARPCARSPTSTSSSSSPLSAALRSAPSRFAPQSVGLRCGAPGEPDAPVSGSLRFASIGS